RRCLPVAPIPPVDAGTVVGPIAPVRRTIGIAVVGRRVAIIGGRVAVAVISGSIRVAIAVIGVIAAVGIVVRRGERAPDQGPGAQPNPPPPPAPPPPPGRLSRIRERDARGDDGGGGQTRDA